MQKDQMDGYKLLMDVPEDKDVGLLESYAEGLSKLIINSDARFSMGIFGGWGTGKTTLMNCIDSKLTSEDIIKVKFNAWRYEKENNLLIPLLHTIKDSLVEFSVEDVAQTIGGVIHSLVAGTSIKFGIPKAFEVTLDGGKALANAENLEKREKAKEDDIGHSVYHTCYKALQKAIKDFRSGNEKKKIVIFMDDLDRCAPESILDVLESMKLFFDTQGVIFVVGLDQKVVEEAIKDKYASFGKNNKDTNSAIIDGAEYLKKMFQLPFHLLPTTKDSLDEILDHIYQSADLCDEQKNEIEKTVKPHLEYLFGNGGVNPREVKRYINSYTITRLTNPDLKENVILVVLTINFRKDWENVKVALDTYKSVFISRLEKFIANNNESWPKLKMPNYIEIPGSFMSYVSDFSSGKDFLSIQEELGRYLFNGEINSHYGSDEMENLLEEVLELYDLIEFRNDDKNLLKKIGVIKDFIASDNSQFIKGFKGHLLELESYLKDSNNAGMNVNNTPKEHKLILINNAVNELV